MSVYISEEKGVRQLHLGSNWVQGAMRIAKPWALELEYTRELLLPLLLEEQSHWPKRVLCIGLGAASIPKFVYKHCPQAHIAVVEISPAVHAVALTQFACPNNNDRFEVVLSCGAAYLRSTRQTFDLIVVDGFDGQGRVGSLGSLEFYQDAKRCLAPAGWLTVNLLQSQKDSHHHQARIEQAFDGRVQVLTPCGSGNQVAVARVGPAFHADYNDLASQAQALKDLTALNLLPTLQRLQQARVVGTEAWSL